MKRPLFEELRLPLLLGFSIVSGLGLLIELIHSYTHKELVEALVEMLSLSHEQNLPTWYSTCLLFSCGLLLWAIAKRATSNRVRWSVLAVGFFYMSLDESVEIHERLGGLFGGDGLLYFDWVIPAGVVVLLVGVAYLPFLRALSPRRRNQFLLAGSLYVGGAVLCELPLGWWTERAGSDNLTYALIDWVEESLEMVGASLFLVSLVEHWYHGLRQAQPSSGANGSPMSPGVALE